ncbi:pyruvate kinase [Candidatus Gracilibacteria bacterium]|nr:pyruvate kinase [Candidatus Gracilibacteria bacterium]NUJ99096.1 pyruvate kinase [Candidatus Gracilibacteria bacterium]
MKKVRIVATMGPAVESEQKIIQLYNAGVNIIRFNFSHANYENARKVANNIKKLNSLGKTKLSLLLDTKGPEIRTGDMDGIYNYKKGEVFKIFVDKTKMKEKSDLFCDYEYLVEDMKVGKSIIIDSGVFIVKVIGKTKDFLEVKALNAASIKSRRHINLPGTKLKLPGLIEQDKKDILFAIENDFDFIAASFIRSKENVVEIKELLKANKGEFIRVLSKIETQEGIDNMDGIIEESDGVMIARGDLGIEVPIEKLAKYQKEQVLKCRAQGKIVITATHFLETMITNPFPTRAESSDITNAVLQKPDTLMLSGETSIGQFPIETAKMMAKIIKEAEKAIDYKYEDFSYKNLSEKDKEKKILIKSGLHLCDQLKIKAMLVFTKSGLLARLTSSFKPKIPVYAFTKEEKVVRYMNILFGIDAISLKDWNQENYEHNLASSIKYLLKNKLVKKEDKVVIITDLREEGFEIPVLEIIHIKDFCTKINCL